MYHIGGAQTMPEPLRFLKVLEAMAAGVRVTLRGYEYGLLDGKMVIFIDDKTVCYPSSPFNIFVDMCNELTAEELGRLQSAPACEVP